MHQQDQVEGTVGSPNISFLYSLMTEEETPNPVQCSDENVRNGVGA